MNTTPSSQITSDIIMQSTIKSLERLVVSKHEAFVGSLSVYEKMLRELERILFLHESFIAGKKEALDSNLSLYHESLNSLKIDFSAFEQGMHGKQEEFSSLLTTQKNQIADFQIFVHEKLMQLDGTLGLHEHFMATKEKDFGNVLNEARAIINRMNIDFQAFGLSMTERENKLALDLLERQRQGFERFDFFTAKLTQTIKVIYWLLGANAVLTLSLLLRWCLK